jgi:regulator of sirC expression with transglutaminase-like and TPR domain
MHELRELLRADTAHVPLDVAALQIATIEYPQLSVEPFLVLLDSHATEFSERVDRRTGGEEFIDRLNHYLFEELGFQGNSDDYYHPANSCLNEVLTRRLGIPITLSLVYIEIGRRLGRPMHGVGLPGHFLVGYDGPDFAAIIDPFHTGQIRSEHECYELAREATGVPLEDDPDLLAPVSNRHIAVRILNNLRSIYFQRREAAKATRVLDLLIEAAPESAEEYKQRGVCLVQTGLYEEAARDLETYLRLAPNAPDRSQVALELQRVRRLLALRA